MPLTLDPKRCAVMAMDFQNEILGMTPQYREKHLLGTVKRVLDAAGHAGADSGYRIIVVTDGCASNTDANHQFFITQILPMLGTAATANEAIAALR